MSENEQVGLWTPANIVTCIRVALVPVWLILAELNVAAPITFVLFLLIGFSDSLDGYLARSRGEVTNFGKFLDPIADKLVVVVVMSFMLEHSQMPILALFIVILREFLVSGLRMVVASSGEVIAASNLGKIKTATTLVALGILLAVPVFPWEQFRTFLTVVGQLTMLAAVILTAWSGIDYFIKCWPYLNGEK